MTLRRRRDDRGVVIPIFAMLLTTLLVMTSFAVDLGRLRAERRDVQADADALALDAVQKMQGLTRDAALAAAIAEANASALRNDYPATLTANEVSVGFWKVDTQELCPGPVQFDPAGVNPPTCGPSSPTDYPDAVQIVLDSTIPMYFDLSSGERSVTRTAVAVARAQTMGELGSVTAGIQPKDPTAGCTIGLAASAQMTFMNHLYTELLGIEAEVRNEGEIDESVDETVSCQVLGPNEGLQLDVASYQGIAATRVLFRDLAAEMGFASTEELLASDVSQRDVLEASADALQRSGNTTDIQVGTLLAKIANETDSSNEFVFGGLFSSVSGTTGNGETAADASINALDLLLMTATAIDGNNFIGADTDFFLPGVLAGVADIKSSINVIEGPKADEDWRSPGQDGPRTSQVTVTLDVPVSFTNASLPLDLSGLLPGVTVNATLNGSGTIPIVVQVGSARTSYPSIQCGPLGEEDSYVRWEVLTSAVRGSIGLLTGGDFSQDANVSGPTAPLITGTADLNVKLPLLPALTVNQDLGALTTVPKISQGYGLGSVLDATGNIDVSLGGGTELHDFVWPYPTDPAHRFRGGITGVGLSDSLVASHTFTGASGGLVGLLGSLNSQVVADQLVKQALAPIMTQVDGLVIEPLLDALGVTAGGADGRNLDVRCQVPALANRG